MKDRIQLLFFLVGLTLLGMSCKSETKIYLRPDVNVAKIEEVLKGNDQDLIDLLNKVRVSVGRRGAGSKTIWSRKKDSSLEVYVSANYVYGVTSWNTFNPVFFDTNAENRGVFETSQIPAVNGSLSLGNTSIADFPLMHFNIAVNVTNSTILPVQDFYIGIIDNQRILQKPVTNHPNIIQNDVPLQMYDPHNRTNAFQNWNNPLPGQNAIAVGYPTDTDKFPNGAVALGKILTDKEAISTIIELKALGDSVGEIAYNSNAEFFIDAQAIEGMSGGGVFNMNGQLIGIMVSASVNDKSPKIIRVVKISYIKSKIISFYHSLSNANRNKIKPFFIGELD